MGLGFPRCVAAIDPGDHRFRLQLVGFVDAWKDFGPGDGKQPSTGASEPRVPPFMDRPVDSGFPRRVGRYQPGGPFFFLGHVEVLHVWKHFGSGHDT